MNQIKTFDDLDGHYIKVWGAIWWIYGLWAVFYGLLFQLIKIAAQLAN